MGLKHLWRLIRQKDINQTTKIQKIGKSEEEKALELEERRNEIELNRLKISEAKRLRFKKELDDIQQNIQDDVDEEDFDEGEAEDDVPEWLAPFVPIITQKLAGGQTQAHSENRPEFQEQAQQQTYAAPQVSDEELRGFLRQLPKSQLKMAKIMPKPALYNIVNQKMPLSPQDFERGYQILVTEF